jgi:hypothetical protein
MNDNRSAPEDHYRDDVPEFVLGVLDGRSRSALLEHLEICDACADEVDALTATSDTLLHVPVSAEPPVGFETRVMARIKSEATQSPRRHLWAMVAAAVIVASLGVGWTIGRFVESSDRSTVSVHRSFEQRALAAGRSRVGVVYAYSGQPAWMFVSVDVPRGPSTLRCVVISTSGVRHVIGDFTLRTGRGSWGTPLPVATSEVRTIELTTLSGSVVATTGDPRWATSPYQAR